MWTKGNAIKQQRMGRKNQLYGNFKRQTKDIAYAKEKEPGERKRFLWLYLRIMQ